MRVLSYNTLFGGFDGADDRRYKALIGIIREADADVLLLQELKGFLGDGGKRLFDLERRIGRRGFIAEARVTGQNTAIFVKPEIEVLSFEADAEHFHHAAAIARLKLPQTEKPLTAISVHLCPNGTPVRLREANYLFNFAIPEDDVIVGGDFNSVAPGDPEPEGLENLPARFRARYTGLDGNTDRRTIASLIHAGFVELGGRFGDYTPTVPGAAFTRTEFVPFRSDYFLVSDALAARAKRYTVIRNEDTDAASDHYPIVAEFGDAG